MNASLCNDLLCCCDEVLERVPLSGIYLGVANHAIVKIDSSLARREDFADVKPASYIGVHY